MNAIKALKSFFSKPPVSRKKIRIYLRRGTMSEIFKSVPLYVGEIVICLDDPCIGVGTEAGFEFIRFDPNSPAAAAIRHHYAEADWIKAAPNW